MAEMGIADDILHRSPGAWQCPEVGEVMRVNKTKQGFN